MSPAPTAAAGQREQGALHQFKARVRHALHAVLDPLARAMLRVGFRADHLTILGLVMAATAGFAFFDGHFRLGALLLLVSGLCDVLDGQLARAAGAQSRFGAFLDSTFDRLSEAAALAGILGFYLRNLVALVFQSNRVLEQAAIGLQPVTWAVLAFTAVTALIGSFLVSYTRARAEGLGLDCRVGWFERPERLVLLIVAGALKVFWAMSAALLLLTLLSFATALQRMIHVWQQTRGAGRDQ